MEVNEIPARQHLYIKQLQCDMCGSKSHGDTYWRYPNDDISYRQEIKIEYTDGSNNVTNIIIDICPDCFKNKLKPYIESFGIRKLEEIDFSY